MIETGSCPDWINAVNSNKRVDKKAKAKNAKAKNVKAK
jgi:hypothetical protein